MIARNGEPVARLVAMPERNRIQFGWAAGQIEIGDDFDAPLPDEIQKHFEGRD